MHQNYILNANDGLTNLVKSNGLHSWLELIEFVKYLPYGRNKNRTNFSLVLAEKRGSCSSKHAVLKKIADLNQIPNIQLILGIYQMNESNTPKIGTELSQNNLDFIPEAHCYLKIDDTRTDVTTHNASFEKIQNSIMLELEIEPEQVIDFKVNFHQDFIKNWLTASDSKFSFDEIWRIREKCINNLTG